jgi:O-antigen ligase
LRHFSISAFQHFSFLPVSIRVTVCALFVIALSFYAYRNWFRSLCGALFLMAFLEHPDMPRSILGIPGFNLWNLLLLNVLFAWMSQRRREGLMWDMPRFLKWAFLLYIAIVVTAFLRALINPTRFYEGGTMAIVVNAFINPLKFLVPCFLLYDGCRTRERVLWASSAIMLLYFFLSVQVIRYMGLHPDFSGNELSARAAKILQRSVGYNRVDMSMMLAGASWAALAFSRLFEKRIHRWSLWGAAGVILLAQSLTGGRTGYLTWGAIGLVLCTVKWRRLLPVIPAAAVAVIVLMPGVAERMLSGFGGNNGAIVVQEDAGEITSGRSVVWPHVIAKIGKSPVLGYGRFAMARTGLTDWTGEELGDPFGHPHNAYLEMLLDNGWVGLFCVLPLFCVVLKRSLGTFVDRRDPVFEAVGGMALALLLALLFGSLGAQTLYPREGVLGMWAAIGIALRASVERAHARSSSDTAAASSWDESQSRDYSFGTG